MPLFGFRHRVDTSHVGGAITALGLADWWLADLTEQQRQQVREAAGPSYLVAHAGATAVDGGSFRSPLSPARDLATLAGIVDRDVDRSLALALADRALAMAQAPGSGSAVDRHFALQMLIDLYRGGRTRPREADRWEAACRAQIAIGGEVAADMRLRYPDEPLPVHRGFVDLARIYRGTPEGDQINAARTSQGWRVK